MKRNDYDEDEELLSCVTGLGDTLDPSEEDCQESQRLIDDPEIPCSDLRGLRDHQYVGDMADAWYTASFSSERDERDE